MLVTVITSVRDSVILSCSAIENVRVAESNVSQESVLIAGEKDRVSV